MNGLRPVARGCGGCDAPPKSAKRSTFSHKVGQKWGFCRRVRGVRFKKVHFLGPKGPLFWGPAPPPKKKIDPGYGPERTHSYTKMLYESNGLIHIPKCVKKKGVIDIPVRLILLSMFEAYPITAFVLSTHLGKLPRNLCISHPVTPFFQICHPMTPFFSRKLSLFTPWFDGHTGGFLVQRSIRGRAAEMGLKISLLA